MKLEYSIPLMFPSRAEENKIKLNMFGQKSIYSESIHIPLSKKLKLNALKKLTH
jgi:hypothetical protein